MLSDLALCFVPVLKVGLRRADHRVLLLVWRVHIHHLYLALRVVDGPLLVCVAASNDFLSAVWSFLSFLQIPCVDNLLLVPLDDLGGVRCVWTCGRSTEASLIVIVHLLLCFHVSHVVLRVQVVVPLSIVRDLVRVAQHLRTLVVTLEDHCTARSLLEAHASTVLLLGGQCDTILGLVDGVVDLASFGSAAGVHGAGACLVVRIVMLHTHCVSTHSFILLGLHVLLKVLELLRAGLLLLMISTTCC